MKYIMICLLVLATHAAKAQELFVFTEPASNMAAKSIGLRLNNYLMQEDGTGKTNYHLLPEFMVGINRHLMFHAEAFLSNRDRGLAYEGASAYLKYRFYSTDEVHSHFRMAAFGRYSRNNTAIHQPAIDFNGHSTGYEAGLIATSLTHKVAVSASASFLHAGDNGSEKFIYPDADRNAVNYTLSVGKLMLPKEYTSYDQTNLNLMCELLAQTNLGTGDTFIDLGPSAQLIFKSRMRLDLGYRFPLVDRLQRTTPRGFVLKLEYNIFNAL